MALGGAEPMDKKSQSDIDLKAILTMTMIGEQRGGEASNAEAGAR
jgi:hypothetical protein